MAYDCWNVQSLSTAALLYHDIGHSLLNSRLQTFTAMHRNAGSDFMSFVVSFAIASKEWVLGKCAALSGSKSLPSPYSFSSMMSSFAIMECVKDWKGETKREWRGDVKGFWHVCISAMAGCEGRKNIYEGFSIYERLSLRKQFFPCRFMMLMRFADAFSFRSALHFADRWVSSVLNTW